MADRSPRVRTHPPYRALTVDGVHVATAGYFPHGIEDDDPRPGWRIIPVLVERPDGKRLPLPGVKKWWVTALLPMRDHVYVGYRALRDDVRRRLYAAWTAREAAGVADEEEYDAPTSPAASDIDGRRTAAAPFN